MSDTTLREKNVTLLDLLDRVLYKGVVIYGDVTISVADIDLVYLGLKVLLTSVERMEEMKQRGYRFIPSDRNPTVGRVSIPDKGR